MSAPGLILCERCRTPLRPEDVERLAAPPDPGGSSMSATERLKGKNGELEVIRILKAHGWPNAERSSNGRVQYARGDVIAGPAGVHLEIKRQERLSVPAALAQAIRDANPLDVPVVVHRPSRHVWMATLPFEELLPLLALRERA